MPNAKAGATSANTLALRFQREPEESLGKDAVLRSYVVVSVFGLGVATGLLAQIPSTPPQRIEQKRTDLTGAPGMEVIASVIEYKPGDIIDAHFHHGVEVAYVLQGSSVQLPGKEPTVLATGATLMNLRNVKHGGVRIVGDTPLKFFTVHIVDKDEPLYDYSK
jgi:quercetin dioxygenase-like cupin family protein